MISASGTNRLPGAMIRGPSWENPRKHWDPSCVSVGYVSASEWGQGTSSRRERRTPVCCCPPCPSFLLPCKIWLKIHAGLELCPRSQIHLSQWTIARKLASSCQLRSRIWPCTSQSHPCTSQTDGYTETSSTFLPLLVHPFYRKNHCDESVFDIVALHVGNSSSTHKK